ncbi:MAG: NAD(+) diphosphatase [Deltaproteobacteria bacterium]|nr:NAD(+) diphosphatase [Deltaproteobacteria bacterium]
MSFVSSFRAPPEDRESDLWFLFRDQHLLVGQKGESLFVPRSPNLERLGVAPAEKEFLGWLDECPCYAAEVQEGEPVSEGFSFMGLRRLFAALEPEVIQVAGLANQLVRWNRNHRHCGRCGNPTEKKTDERARVCPQCGCVAYPRISPAIIVAVVKDHQILLANSQRFPGKFYSVLAGFVEPGETLEACVKREVFEEVGVSLKNIRYFGSQPWPFPDSLMIAFTAEYEGGTIRIDPSEITEAGWFRADGLPAVPPRISIARHLIDWFVERERTYV